MKEFIRIVERNMKKEIERRNWREGNEQYGKYNRSNYNLDGNMEGLLNFMYWRCDCCQQGFQRVIPALYEKDTFSEGGRNVIVEKDNFKRRIPLCNTCILLYYHNGWLASPPPPP